MTSNPNQVLDTDETRSRLLNHRNYLQELTADQIRAFDRAILSLSSGALALSTAFAFRPHADPKEHISSSYLIISWVCFVICILTNLISYKLAALDSDGMMKEVDAALKAGSDIEFKISRFGHLTRASNYFSLLMFAIGTISLLVFVYQNS